MFGYWKRCAWPGRRLRVRADGASDAQDTCRVLAETTLIALGRIDAKNTSGDYRPSEINRSKMLAGLARSLILAELDVMCWHKPSRTSKSVSETIPFCAHCPVASPGRTTSLAYREGRWGDAGGAGAVGVRLPRACDELASLTAVTPQPPADFRRAADVQVQMCRLRRVESLSPRFASRRAGLSSRLPQDRSHAFGVAHPAIQMAIWTSGPTNARVRRFLSAPKNTASHDRRLAEYHEDLENT